MVHRYVARPHDQGDDRGRIDVDLHLPIEHLVASGRDQIGRGLAVAPAHDLQAAVVGRRLGDRQPERDDLHRLERPAAGIVMPGGPRAGYRRVVSVIEERLVTDRCRSTSSIGNLAAL
jgi:hypothetical protein